MALRCRLLPLGRILLLAGLGLLPAAAALAGPPRCITARSQCPASGFQPPGTHCACPDYPNVWGFVTVTGTEQPAYPAYEHRRRDELRNDDLDKGDDVLAGPRWHHRRGDGSGGNE
jgi:hypothetical protein